MDAIGIDTHKDSLAACAIDALGTVRAEAAFANDPAGHAALGAWAARVAARDDVLAEATRIRNRLHADLVVLVPGYGGRVARLVAERELATAGRALHRLDGVHAELARARLAELRRQLARARALAARIERLVGGHPLVALPGAGPLTVATLIAETGELGRFRSADAFAMPAGVAPIPASSGQVHRMRLNRGGNRQLNRALHVIALAQARWFAPARAFVTRKIAEGHSWKEAIRALKRHLARIVFRLLQEGAARFTAAA